MRVGSPPMLDNWSGLPHTIRTNTEQLDLRIRIWIGSQKGLFRSWYIQCALVRRSVMKEKSTSIRFHAPERLQATICCSVVCSLTGDNLERTCLCSFVGFRPHNATDSWCSLQWIGIANRIQSEWMDGWRTCISWFNVFWQVRWSQKNDIIEFVSNPSIHHRFQNSPALVISCK